MRLSSVKGISVVAAAMLAATVSTSVSAFDVEAAKELARNNKCFDCHATDKDGDGPGYNKVAAKYKGKPEAETLQRLTVHITTGEKAKFPDGHEEEHHAAQPDAAHRDQARVLEEKLERDEVVVVEPDVELVDPAGRARAAFV